MDSAKAEIENKIRFAFAELTKSSLLCTVFADAIAKDSPDVEEEKLTTIVNELSVLWRSLPHEKGEEVYRLVISFRGRSSFANLFVKRVTSMLIECQLLPVKFISECMLTCQDFCFNNENVWKDTFHFLRQNLSSLDYKGVRDTLKLILEQSIPVHLRPSQRDSAEVAEEHIRHICSREANLLPAYFVINEIKKMFPDVRCFSHWRLADMYTKIVDSFRPLAQMVSVTGRAYLAPISSHVSLYFSTFWKLDPVTLRLSLKGFLPYAQSLVQPQCHLVYHTLLQSSYREILNVLISTGKHEKVRCPMLEEIVLSIILEVMCEIEKDSSRQHRYAWQVLATELVYMVVQQMISFTRLVQQLHLKLTVLPYRKARDQLMWCLFQFISGGIQKAEEFFLILDLYRLLYSGSDIFTVSGSDASCVYMMAATCIWIHILKKAQGTELDIPPSINTQIKFMQESLKNKSQFSVDNFMLAVLCNAYSTTQEIFQQELMPILMENLETNRSMQSQVSSTTVPLPGGLVADSKIRPLKFEFLDSVTVHVRMNIVHSLFNSLARHVQSKSNVCLSPALLETYSRLLTYTDTEVLGLKQFVTHLLTITSKNYSVEMMHIICEILSYRLHQIPAAYRIHAIASIQHAATATAFQSNPQLYWMIENTLLRQIHWFSYAEILQPQYARFLNMLATSSNDGARPMIVEIEELTKVVVLSLARSMTTAASEGSFNENNFREIFSRFPAHSWPSSSLHLFPTALCSFYASQQNFVSLQQNRLLLHQQVEEEYIKWRTLGTDMNLIDYFTCSSQYNVYLCLLWRLLYENGDLPPVAIKILENLGPKKVSIQMKTLADFLVKESNGSDINRTVDSLNRMIWNYAVFPFDRFILTMIFRHFEGNDAFYALVIVVLLLQRSEEFRACINDCIALLPMDYCHSSDWYEKHMTYHQKHPEMYWAQVFNEMTRNHQVQTTVLPVYFRNVCLSFIPVLDLLIQKLIELPSVCLKFLDPVINFIGPLFRFHPHPVTFLYTTFRFYDKKLIDSSQVKLKLVSAIHNAFAGVRGESWLVSADFLQYMTQVMNDSLDSRFVWLPEMDYFVQLVKRLIDCFASPFQLQAYMRKKWWRFSEFPTLQNHIVHAICIELMCLPCAAPDIGNSLLNVVLKWPQLINRSDIYHWLNCIGLILSALPLQYSESLYKTIKSTICSEELAKMDKCIFEKLNFEKQLLLINDNLPARVLALAHAIWSHFSPGYLQTLPQVLRERWKQQVKTEEQLIYVCHLVSPFLQRFHQERTKYAVDIACDVYEMLLNVDKNCAVLQYEDTIADLCYHMKYMYVGDSIRSETDRIIMQLRPSLQLKLRYISNVNFEHGGGSAAGAGGASSVASSSSETRSTL